MKGWLKVGKHPALASVDLPGNCSLILSHTRRKSLLKLHLIFTSPCCIAVIGRRTSSSRIWWLCGDFIWTCMFLIYQSHRFIVKFCLQYFCCFELQFSLRAWCLLLKSKARSQNFSSPSLKESQTGCCAMLMFLFWFFLLFCSHSQG